MPINRIMLICALAACGDSTNIQGDYRGNLTFTASITAPASMALVGAAPGDVVVDSADSSGARVTLGDGCALDTLVSKQSVVEDYHGSNRFVFTAENVAAMQPCTLAVTGGTLAFTVAQGDFVVEAGLTMTLELGGTLTAAPGSDASDGYVAVSFGGVAD